MGLMNSSQSSSPGDTGANFSDEPATLIFFISCSLVVVNDFNVSRFLWSPFETDPPLIVNPDAHEFFAASLKSSKLVAMSSCLSLRCAARSMDSNFRTRVLCSIFWVSRSAKEMITDLIITQRMINVKHVYWSLRPDGTEESEHDNFAISH